MQTMTCLLGTLPVEGAVCTGNTADQTAVHTEAHIRNFDNLRTSPQRRRRLDGGEGCSFSHSVLCVCVCVCVCVGGGGGACMGMCGGVWVGGGVRWWVVSDPDSCSC